jgi:hypothetical protein
MSPSDPVCPGNRVIFTCQQSGTLARWTITLLSGGPRLQNTAQSSEHSAGSLLTFADDPGFNFEIHVVFSSSNSITTELQVAAVRELNRVTVECTGFTRRFMSTIIIASIGEFVIILQAYQK